MSKDLTKLGLFLISILLFQCTFQQVQIKIQKPKIIQELLPEGVQTKVLMWGKRSTMEDLEVTMKLADPNDGCEEYQNIDPKIPTAYFVREGGKCSIGTLIHNAQVAHAQALIIKHKTDDLEDIEQPDHISGIIFLNHKG